MRTPEEIKTPLDMLDLVSQERGHESWYHVYRIDKSLDALNMVPQHAATRYANQFKPQWIPVTERLPECNSEDTSNCVMISNCVLVTDGRFHDVGHVDEDGKWTVYNSYLYMEGANVTHYMPLPEPPIK